MPHQYVIVGSGMYGAVFARTVAERGQRVLIVDKRPHIGGNCYSYEERGIQVHAYGPHIFHTNNRPVWEFVNRFARFHPYRHRVAVNYRGKLLSFPINLMTLAQLWGVATPQEAEAKLAQRRVPCEQPANLEEWILSQVGWELYETFVQGYTTKQWGRDPKSLPASIIRRIPIRLTYNDHYFDDEFQGIPVGGYTALFERMLDHPNIRVETGVDFFAERRRLEQLGRTLVYTGKIDEFYDYRFGRLEYRSLRFENQVREGDFQGAAIVNYTEADVPFTRICEHKHFAGQSSSHTVITREYPQAYDETKIPYYPIRDAANTAVYERYRELSAASGVIFGGRLGTYRYFDMHQVIAEALADAQRELGVATRAAA